MNDNNNNNLEFDEKYVNEIEKIETIENDFDDICEYQNEIEDSIGDLEHIKEMFKNELTENVFQTEEIMDYIDDISDLISELENESSEY